MSSFLVVYKARISLVTVTLKMVGSSRMSLKTRERAVLELKKILFRVSSFFHSLAMITIEINNFSLPLCTDL